MKDYCVDKKLYHYVRKKNKYLHNFNSQTLVRIISYYNYFILFFSGDTGGLGRFLKKATKVYEVMFFGK